MDNHIDLDIADAVAGLTVSHADQARLNQAITALESFSTLLERERGQCLSLETRAALDITTGLIERAGVTSALESLAHPDTTPMAMILTMENINDFLEKAWAAFLRMCERVHAFLKKAWHHLSGRARQDRKTAQELTEFLKQQEVKPKAAPEPKPAASTRFTHPRLSSLAIAGEVSSDLSRPLKETQRALDSLQQIFADLDANSKAAMRMIHDSVNGKEPSQLDKAKAFSHFERGIFQKIDDNRSRTVDLPGNVHFEVNFDEDHNFHVSRHETEGKEQYYVERPNPRLATSLLVEWTHVNDQLDRLLRDLERQQSEVDRRFPKTWPRQLNVKSKPKFDQMLKDFRTIEQGRAEFTRAVLLHLSKTLHDYLGVMKAMSEA